MGNIPVCSSSNPKQRKKDELSSSTTSSSGTSSRRQPYVFGTLRLNGYADVSKSLKAGSTMIPRRILVAGKFLNTMTDFPTPQKRCLRRVLRRGCTEVALAGTNPQAPRRVYETEINFVLSRLNHMMIETLELENLGIQREGRVPSHLVNNLQKLTNLQRLTIESSRMDSCLLEDLLSVLETMPELRHLTLNLCDLAEDQTEAIEETVTHLLNKSILIESLSMPQYPTSQAFWQAVANSPSLQYLSVPCQDLERVNGLALVKDLLANNGPLTSLHLRLLHGDLSYRLLAEGLSHSTLESLELSLDHDTYTSSGPLLEALEPVLENDNFTLTQLQIQRDMKGDIPIRIPTPKMDLYTHLNRHGRFHLLRGEPTREEWLETLADASSASSLSNLFYLLRVHPTLIDS